MGNQHKALLQQIVPRIYSRVVNLMGMFIFFLCWSQVMYAQATNYLNIDHTDASKFDISVFKEINTKNNLVVYKAKLEGKVLTNQIVRWRVRVKEKNNSEVIKTVSVSVHLRKNMRDTVFNLLEAYQFIAPLWIDEGIRPDIVVLPELTDFEPRMESGFPFLVKGDPFVLTVNVNRNFPNIEWVWKVDNDPGARLTGERFQQAASRNKTYRVYARYQGSDFFRTPSKKVDILVQDPTEIIDFTVRSPGRTVDDTGSLKLGIDIRKDITRGEIEFRWYAKSFEASRIPLRVGSNLVVPPPLVTTDFIVCAYHQGRRLTCVDHHQPINLLPGPGEFEMQSPGRLFTNQPVVIRVRSKDIQARQFWTWSVNGRLQTSKGADTFLIPSPKPGMQVCTYPTLHGKGGASMQKCVSLSDVRVMTILPSGIEGSMSRCKGDDLKSRYRLTGGMLGSDAKAWVLFEGDKKIRMLKPGSDTLMLAPDRTTTYRISTEGDPQRFYSFKVEVTESPRLPNALKGAELVCPGEFFQMEAIGGKPDSDTRWLWYRTIPGQYGSKIIGEGVFVNDSIRSRAVYTLVAEKGECAIKLKADLTVNVYTSPPLPPLSVKYLGKGQRYADLQLAEASSKDIVYEWTLDGFSSIAHTGQQWGIISIPKNGLSVSVRAINKCGVTSIPSVKYLYRSSSPASRTPMRFLNLGIATNNPSSFGNIRMVIGSKWLWGSVIFNPVQVLGYPGYKKSISGTDLEIDDAGMVSNFPPAIGSYYEVNGNDLSVRSGILLGTMIGRGRIKAFAGAGFGSRSLKWGLDVRPYNGTTTQKVWAKSVNGSWTGAAVEGGVFINFGGANLMLGMQSIIDPDRPTPYIDATAGLGIRLKKSSR